MTFASAASILDELISTRDHVQVQIAECKDLVVSLNERIAVLTGEAVAKAFVGKEVGTTRFAIGSKIYKAEIDKTVKWDSAALETIASTMPWNEARALFKITFEVPEKNFKDAGDNLKALLMAARTVKYGQPKISVAS